MLSSPLEIVAWQLLRLLLLARFVIPAPRLLMLVAVDRRAQAVGGYSLALGP